MFIYSWLLILLYFFFDYSLTNVQKSEIFDIFRLIKEFYHNFFLHSLKCVFYKQSFFSGTLIHLYIFYLTLFRVLFVAWFTQHTVLTELISPISSSEFSFVKTFPYLFLRLILLVFQTKVSFGSKLDGRTLYVSFFWSSRVSDANIGI